MYWRTTSEIAMENSRTVDGCMSERMSSRRCRAISKISSRRGGGGRRSRRQPAKPAIATSTPAAIHATNSHRGKMLLGPRMSRISSSDAVAVAEAGVDPEPATEEGFDGDTRAGVSADEYVGAGPRAGGGGEKISGVDGTRGTGAVTESGAAEAGSGAAVSAKDRVPANTATRPILKAVLTWEARLLMRALIRACVAGS